MLSDALVFLSVNRLHRKFAEIAVDAVLAVADLERRDVNLDLIKLEGKVGGTMADSCLVHGIILDKEISHSQMRKEIKGKLSPNPPLPFSPFFPLPASLEG